MIVLKKRNKPEKNQFSKSTPFTDLYTNKDPYIAIQSGKIMAKAWARSFTENEHLPQAQTFIFKIIESYWQKIHDNNEFTKALPFLFERFSFKRLDKSALALAKAIGMSAAKLNVIEASYHLGNIYTSVLTDNTRSSGGIFYTPPVLTSRLIYLSENAGVNWRTAKVIDPACGGGAFLAPVCLKIAERLVEKEPNEILKHIQDHVVGWEIDPFGAWLTQVFVEVALMDIIKKADIKLQPLVRLSNSLETEDSSVWNSFDLVIGNPPYGKVKLTEHIRNTFGESLYGHPNYYGLFTHLAIKLASRKGIIAYLTPTSFLSGEYFKNLRQLLRKESTPLEIDFVSFRKGVFDGVLQETMLAAYRKQDKQSFTVKVNQITTTIESGLQIIGAGDFRLSEDLQAPWILPRTPGQAIPVQSMKKMRCRLKDWGYKVSTGPLVWNRHKRQLCQKENKNTYPIIWAESITQDGRFILKAEKKNHSPYFKFQAGDEWLIVSKPCILLQRTTAKEQDKRLIAAAIPVEIFFHKRGVVIENHLNMIIATLEKPLVHPMVLSAFLNSKAVNEAFRTISGSVAISAYELEALPLPDPKELLEISTLLQSKSDQFCIETACQRIYNLNNE